MLHKCVIIDIVGAWRKNVVKYAEKSSSRGERVIVFVRERAACSVALGRRADHPLWTMLVAGIAGKGCTGNHAFSRPATVFTVIERAKSRLNPLITRAIQTPTSEMPDGRCVRGVERITGRTGARVAFAGWNVLSRYPKTNIWRMRNAGFLRKSDAPEPSRPEATRLSEAQDLAGHLMSSRSIGIMFS